MPVSAGELFLAVDRAPKRGEQNKTRFNAKVRAAEMVTGDRALVQSINAN